MDWDAVIERNREALKRVVAVLVAMAGIPGPNFSPCGLRGRFAPEAQSCRAGGAITGGEGRDAAGGSGDPAGSSSASRPTLPRHLHRAVLRLLRPAEAAVRRLVIVAARDLVVTLPPARPRKPTPKPMAPVLRSLGLAVFQSPAEAARAAALARRPHPIRKFTLPLTDPLRAPRPGRPRTVPPHAAPRILSFDGRAPHRLPPPPSLDDPIDATTLGVRLEALASALDDLPGHARRFARWKARRDRSLGYGRFRRRSPLRPGRPPGGRQPSSRRPAHEVHDVLGDLQYFAFEALMHPDTS